MSLIKISPVDGAECCPIIEDFDQTLILIFFTDTDIFAYSTQTIHNQQLFIAAPVITGVGLNANS